jgi:hypothetical protein
LFERDEIVQFVHIDLIKESVESNMRSSMMSI